MLTDRDIERRLRYLLAKHNLRFHKIPGSRGPIYYVYEIGADDSPPDDSKDSRCMDLDELLEFAAELAEKEATE